MSLTLSVMIPVGPIAGEDLARPGPQPDAGMMPTEGMRQGACLSVVTQHE